MWHHEFPNVLANYHRFDEVPLTRLLPAWFNARSLFDGSTHRVDRPQALRIAGERNIIAYDAQFAALAQSRGAPLITQDRRLLRAVPDLALTPRQYPERIRH